MGAPVKSFDFIICGGGTAGCILASRLSDDRDCRVLLVEAGGGDQNPLFRMPAGFAKMTKGIASWGWSTVPQRHMQDRVLWYTQAKVIGGGSTVNAQVYTRGNPADYDAWANEDGCTGWSFQEILPYFKRTEGNELLADEYHGGDGPIGVSIPRATLPITDALIRAGQQFGLPFNPDFNGFRQEGIGRYQLTQRDSRRSSTAMELLAPARDRSNLTVLQETEIARLVIENHRATAIEIRSKSNGSTERINAEREILITSGAIGSPRLLQLSGIGSGDHLRSLGMDVVHDLAGVGQNLQDHIDFAVISECRGRFSYDSVNQFHNTIAAGLRYYFFKNGPVASSLFETGGFAYADEAARSPDIQFHFGQGSGIEKGIVKLDSDGVTLNSAFMRPHSRGSVELASADPGDAPLIDPNFWSDPYDREISLKGLEMAREIMRQPALEPFIKREALPGNEITSREDLINYACQMGKTDHHPVGTCKMGHGDDAVVTPELKVHGLEGLRVCDSSIMPQLISSNTNAATMMIGEKAADLIRGIDPPAPLNLRTAPVTQAVRPGVPVSV